MTEIILREGKITDNELIAKLAADTFTESFAAQNTAEDLALYIQQNYTPENLALELTNPDMLYFIALEENEAIGFVKLRTNEDLIELKGKKSIEIQQIYVLQSHHKRKVGAMLMQKSIEIAISLEMEVIWLGVWEHNHKALEFYQKWGFERFGTHNFVLGNDVQNDYLLSKSL